MMIEEENILRRIHKIEEEFFKTQGRKPNVLRIGYELFERLQFWTRGTLMYGHSDANEEGGKKEYMSGMRIERVAGDVLECEYEE